MNVLKGYIEERMKHHQVIGFSAAMMANGELQETLCYGKLDALEGGEIRPNTRFAACSISKLATAVLTLMMAERGRLQLDTPVNDYLRSWLLPENQLPGGSEVTLRNLLCHQSGIVDRAGSFDMKRKDERIPAIGDILAGRTRFYPEPVHVSELPGSAFHYSDAGYCVIQQVIEDRCGKPFETVMKDTVFGPLGMTESGYACSGRMFTKDLYASGHGPSGERTKERFPCYPFSAAAGLWSTPTDLTKLALEIVRAFKGESKLGLSKTIAMEMLSPQGCTDFTGLGVFLDSSKGALHAASYGWGIGFQSMLLFEPLSGKGIVLMHNTETGRHQLEGLIGDVFMKLGWK